MFRKSVEALFAPSSSFTMAWPQQHPVPSLCFLTHSLQVFPQDGECLCTLSCLLSVKVSLSIHSLLSLHSTDMLSAAAPHLMLSQQQQLRSEGAASQRAMFRQEFSPCLKECLSGTAGPENHTADQCLWWLKTACIILEVI